ncbi:MAG: MarR family transcriptional regulator [Gammaproteobacteria bacterium]|nr:MarR family transcriptional regulator [Gammaproteobacteria bacterium]
MDSNNASRFIHLYRTIFETAARRIRDKREGLSNETFAILHHMANLGPCTLGELSHHFDRAPSTLSETFKHLEQKGLIERQKDDNDKRRVMIWLSQKGFTELQREYAVLDQTAVAEALQAMGNDGEKLLALLNQFVTHLNRGNSDAKM